MQLPRRFPLLVALGALLLSHPAAADKPRFPVERIPIGALPEGGPAGCTMGVTGDPGGISNFIVPPDDIYYTLLRVNDCATCVSADTATFTKVHLWLEYRQPCEMPIAIGLVGAVESSTTPGCYEPNLTDVRYPPEDFLITPPATPDTVEHVFTLSGTAIVDGRAFLTINFRDTTAGCIRPRLVLRRNPPNNLCPTCVSYNEWLGADDVPDDLCIITSPEGNPMMSVEVDTCYPIDDLVAPAAVTDLGRDSTAFNAVRLTWTSPGDDGTTGTAAWYELRRSTSLITDANFESADSIAAPTPSVAGTAERALAGGLSESTSYWFALKAHDEGGNTAPLSNVLAVTTSPGIPAPVGLLEVLGTTKNSVSLTWRAGGDDGNVGRPLRYLIAVSTAPITAANFYASLRDSVPATVDPGGQENAVVSGLLSSTDYVLAVRTRDDLGYVSDVVTIGARTEPGGPIEGRSAPAIAPLEQPSRLPVPIHWLGFAGEARQSIRIYDLSGRLVRTLTLSSEAGGVVDWDGLNDDGKKVQAGLYVAKLTTGARVAKSRIMLLK